jgi:hypothetical protein
VLTKNRRLSAVVGLLAPTVIVGSLVIVLFLLAPTVILGSFAANNTKIKQKAAGAN